MSDPRSTIHDPRSLPWWLPLYDAVLALAGALYLPYYLLVRRPGHPGIAQRFGHYPPATRGDPPVWLHAVSVGEVVAALPLLAALRAAHPSRRWVLSTATPTGQRLARERLQQADAAPRPAGQCLPARDTVLYAPWDVTPCVRRAVAAIRPRLFLGLETELWPNLLLRLGAAGVPIAVVNGRISDRSFRRYAVVRRGLRPVLASVQLWAMQTRADAERITALGVDPARVHVVGNMKADVAPPVLDAMQSRRLQERLGMNGRTPVWVAGSTHPGEEAMVLSAFRQVRVDQRALQLILAPRHPERILDVERTVRHAGFVPRRWSQASGEPWEEGTVVIVDTLGELPRFYALADVVFVGGSLVPHGGHNLLEPAQLAKPVVTGPFTHNFRSIAELLRAAGGLEVVTSVEQLAAQVRHWLARPERRRQVGERAKQAVAAQAGATARTVELLDQQFGDSLS